MTNKQIPHSVNQSRSHYVSPLHKPAYDRLILGWMVYYVHVRGLDHTVTKGCVTLRQRGCSPHGYRWLAIHAILRSFLGQIVHSGPSRTSVKDRHIPTPQASITWGPLLAGVDLSQRESRYHFAEQETPPIGREQGPGQASKPVPSGAQRASFSFPSKLL